MALEAQFYGADLSYGGHLLLRRLISTRETHFYGGSFLRKRLISTEDVHFKGGDSFLRSTRFYGVDSLQRRRLMNELPVIESLYLRKDFWDRHGANIATR